MGIKNDLDDRKVLEENLSELKLKKNTVDQLLADLNRLKNGQELESKLSSENREGANDPAKILLENQTKLDRLYTMQSRLQRDCKPFQ